MGVFGHRENHAGQTPVSRHPPELGGRQRYIKVKADANPYVPESGRYFWRRRHEKASRLLPAMSARESRAMA